MNLSLVALVSFSLCIAYLPAAAAPAADAIAPAVDASVNPTPRSRRVLERRPVWRPSAAAAPSRKGGGADVAAIARGARLRSPASEPEQSALIGSPFSPADIAHIYHFTELYGAGFTGQEGRHSTIAIATAFDFDPADLQQFWVKFDIRRELDSVEVIRVEGTDQQGLAADRRETTLDVQWASAMAPGARILIYAGSDLRPSTFLKVYDRIVTENRAAIMVTSWGLCEKGYTPYYLQQVDKVFQRAATQGMTLLAASGDQGAFDCQGLEEPAVSFPASHPHVLAVGGTRVSGAFAGAAERAWGHSGGGVSAIWPAPPWQMHADANRVLADVALNADPASGYLTIYDGVQRIMGGTSAAAPIWAALVALINQYRAAAERPPLGLAAPELCEVANARDLSPIPFRDITRGDNGAFRAGRGWDHPTGWGSPHAHDLARTLALWTPARDANGGVSRATLLRPVRADVAGMLRLRVGRRCLTTCTYLHGRDMAPGLYTLGFNGEPVASFAVGADGRALLQLAGVDARDKRVTVSATGGELVFAGVLNARSRARLRADLLSTAPGSSASGRLLYRSSHGRERLALRVRGLPPGQYEVAVDDQPIGTITNRGAGGLSVAHFDSAGRRGLPLPRSPLCRTVSVRRLGRVYLRTPPTALCRR